jgi:branched-chain amino acid transport system substrate-binding protein
MRLTVRILTAAVFSVVGVFPTSGQAVDTARAAALYPFDSVIEDAFWQGIEAWDRADYDTALDRFKSVIARPENRRTTAAMLMAGRTLLVTERYGEAIGLLASFVERYPESRYVDAASETLELARQRYELQRRRDEGVFELGVLLPMSDGAVRFTRSMFTGIRMAVDQFNERGGTQVRMVFEDSGADPDKAIEAFNRLMGRSNPGAVIGPLYSEEAVAVSELADSAGVLLLVPLATDGAVTLDKTSVFQANPTYESRGRIMARYAVQRLRHGSIGVLADSTSFAERMARAFEEEALELGAEVPLFGLFTGLDEWYSIAERYGATEDDEEDTEGPGPNRLEELDALYLPVTGEDAAGLATIALDELNFANPNLPLLGNGEWAHVPEPERMARHRMVYGSDFRVDSTDSDVVEFDREFRRRMGRSPDQPAFVGFDVTSFLLGRLRSISQTESLIQSIHDSGEFSGLGIRIYFGDDQVNRSLFFTRYTDQGWRRD